MNDDQLREMMRQLPPIGARPGFTRRVLAEMEDPARSPRSSAVRWRWAVAALVLVVALTGWRMVELSQERAHRAEVEALRLESDRLSAELEALRERAAEAPVVYLGGTEDVDYVIDFARFETSGSVRTAGL